MIILREVGNAYLDKEVPVKFCKSSGPHWRRVWALWVFLLFFSLRFASNSSVQGLL